MDIVNLFSRMAELSDCPRFSPVDIAFTAIHPGDYIVYASTEGIKFGIVTVLKPDGVRALAVTRLNSGESWQLQASGKQSAIKGAVLVLPASLLPLDARRILGAAYSELLRKAKTL